MTDLNFPTMLKFQNALRNTRMAFVHVVHVYMLTCYTSGGGSGGQFGFEEPPFRLTKRLSRRVRGRAADVADVSRFQHASACSRQGVRKHNYESILWRKI